MLSGRNNFPSHSVAVFWELVVQNTENLHLTDSQGGVENPDLKL